MRAAGNAAISAGAGAATAYLFDPQQGRSRRAQIWNQVVSGTHQLRDGAETFADDAANRGRGIITGIRYRITGRSVDDWVLHERVRSRLGRYIPNPHAAEVHVDNGMVTLTGDVLARDEQRAQRAVRRVPGVRNVDARWTVHEDAAGVSALQGDGQPEPVPELLQQHWSPTARVLVTAGAALLWGLSARLPRPLAWILRGIGIAFAVRAGTNLSAKRITGVTAGRRSIDVQDAIMVAAPSDKVWSLVSNYTSFPQIMPDVREVRRDGNGRSHWVISGPVGMPVRFDAEETKRDEGREIAWKTREGQLIAHSGQLRLDPDGDGSTRVAVQLTYNPIAGGVGHSVARLFRADPKNKLHGDLQRLKSFLETGKYPRDAAQPVR